MTTLLGRAVDLADRAEQVLRDAEGLVMLDPARPPVGWEAAVNGMIERADTLTADVTAFDAEYVRLMEAGGLSKAERAEIVMHTRRSLAAMHRTIQMLGRDNARRLAEIAGEGPDRSN